MKSNEFRILGSELGETDGFVDVIVDGIDSDGTIYFLATDGSGREWSLTNERLTELMEDDFMLDSADVDAHKLWDRLGVLGEDREKNVTNNFADDHVTEAQRQMFRAAFEETR